MFITRSCRSTIARSGIIYPMCSHTSPSKRRRLVGRCSAPATGCAISRTATRRIAMPPRSHQQGLAALRLAERRPRRYSGLHLLRARPIADCHSPARRVYQPELALRRSASQSAIRCRVGSDTPDRLPHARQFPGLYTYSPSKRLSFGSTFDKQISEQLMLPAQLTQRIGKLG
jgi:pimeloyl-ACP methyl ester carboxylesterase